MLSDQTSDATANHRPWTGSWYEALLFSAGYLASVYCSLGLIIQPANVSVFWPPSGLLLAFLLCRQRESWIKAACLLIPLSTILETSIGRSPALAFAYTCVDMLTGLSASYLLQRFYGPRFQLRSVKALLGFVLVACGLCNVMGAMLAATIATIAKEPGSFVDVWKTWYIACTLGVLTVSPLFLSLCESRWKKATIARTVEAIIVSALVVTLSLFVFLTPPETLDSRPALLFSTFPALLWAGVRFGVAGAALSSFVLSVVASVCTINHVGPFSHFQSPIAQVHWLQFFIMMLTGTSLVLSANIREREDTAESLRLTQFTMDHAADAVIWTGRDAKVRYANNAAAELLGVDVHDLVGRDIQDFDPSWPKPRWNQAWKMLRRNRITTFEREISPVGRARTTVEISTSYIQYGSDELYIAYVRDVSARNQIEHALRASEQRYRVLFEQASDGIFVSDTTGDYVDVNETGCQMVGYSRDELLGMNVRELLAPGSDISEPLRLDELESGVLVISQRQLRQKDGTLISVEISAKKQADGRYHAIVRDVSGRLEAEVLLTKSLNQTRRIIEALPCGIVQVDLNRRILLMNDYARKFLAMSPDAEPDSIEALDLRVIDGGSRVTLPGADLIQEVIRTKTQSEPSLFTLGLSNGEIRHTVVTAMPFLDPATNELTGIIFAFLDLTKQREDEQQLREAEARIRLSVEALPVVFWTADTDLVLTSVHGAAIDIIAGDEPPDINPTLIELFGSEESDPIQAHRTALSGMRQSFDWRIRDVDLQFLVEPLRNAEDEIIGVVSLGVDISERKRIEQQMRDLNDELEQRVKLRTAELQATVKELESFSYSVSHDLRSPLRALSGYSYILLEDYGDQFGGEAQDMLRRIDVNARRMSSLIDDLLAFSRTGRQPIEKKTEVLDHIARAAWEELQEADNVDSTLSLEPLGSAEVDANLLHLVFVNLISNAVKFSRDASNHTITVGKVEGSQPPVFFVRDHGIGFEMRHADKLFGVFARLSSDDKYEGTGVGLAIVQRIIHRHGGRIWAESEPGVVTTFYFTVS